MDSVIKVATGVTGSLTVYLWGGWSSGLQALLVLVIIDFLLGVIVAGKERQLSSRVGGRGILKKIMMFIIVAIAHMADTVVGSGHLFRDGAVFFT